MSEICENCKPLFEKLLKRIEELEKRLALYENAHTPSSRLIFRSQGQNNNKPRGRPKGCEGSTRAIPKPDRTLERKIKKCPDCNRN